MKILKSQIAEAIEKLKKVNGKRSERVVSEKALLDLITRAEEEYKKHSDDKWFKAVVLKEMGTWESKPNAYKWKSPNTVITIIIEKGKDAKVEVCSASWGYVNQECVPFKVIYE